MSSDDDEPPFLLEPIAPVSVPPFLRVIQPERARMPLLPGNHGPVSEIFRQAALDALHTYGEQVAALSDAVRSIPDDDGVADELISRILATQNTVGDFLRLFRQNRECQGQG